MMIYAFFGDLHAHVFRTILQESERASMLGEEMLESESTSISKLTIHEKIKIFALLGVPHGRSSMPSLQS